MEAAPSDDDSSGSGGIIQERESGFRIADRAGEERRSSMVAMAKKPSSVSSNNHYQQQAQYQAPQAPRRWHSRVAQKLERWLFLYNVTTGLYMLDWWERCIFNAVFVAFFAVVGYNSGHYLQRIGAGLFAWAWCGDSAMEHQGLLAGAAAGTSATAAGAG